MTINPMAISPGRTVKDHVSTGDVAFMAHRSGQLDAARTLAEEIKIAALDKAEALVIIKDYLRKLGVDEAYLPDLTGPPND